MQTHNQHREKHSMAACINWTFIIIVLVLFLAVLRYDFHRATYAFQSHQKIGLFSILNFHMRLLWRISPILFFLAVSPILAGYTIVVTSVLRIQTA